ncbi:hypothetical protein AB0J86_16380 [Micromonospora sp. NPDC049559]|uniref:hypothetical protein n=1 Tax=Micromonospora sp. NPDC049559 TaxID=3155923 RepID=UPI0034426021
MTSEPSGPDAPASPTTDPEPTPGATTGAEPAMDATEAATGGAEAEQATGPAEPAATLAITTPPSATKVRIDTPGASIEIEAHEPLGNVVETALRLFHEAGGWPQQNTRAAGFAQSERRDTPPAQASSMPYAPGAYPVQYP